MKKYEKILMLIVKSQKGGITQKEITEKIKVDSEHVRKVTKELEKDELIYKRKEGKTVRYYPNEKLFIPSTIYKNKYDKIFDDIHHGLVSIILQQQADKKPEVFIYTFARYVGALITYILLKSNDSDFTKKILGKENALPEFVDFFILRFVESISSVKLLVLFRDILQFLELTYSQNTFYTYQLDRESIKKLEDSFKNQFPDLYQVIEITQKELEEEYAEKVDEYVKHWVRHEYSKKEDKDSVKLEYSKGDHYLEIKRSEIVDDPKIIQYLESKMPKCKEENHLWKKPDAPFFYCYGYKCFYCQKTIRAYFFPFKKFRKIEDQIQFEKGKTEEGFDVFIKILYELLNYFQIHCNRKIHYLEIENHLKHIIENTSFFTQRDTRFYKFTDKISYVIDLLIENDYIHRLSKDVFLRKWDNNFAKHEEK